MGHAGPPELHSWLAPACKANGLPGSRSNEEEDWISSQARDYLKNGLIKTTWISLFTLPC